jgi:hypothetical protein
VIKEALELLFSVGHKASDVKVIDLPGNKLGIVSPDGGIQEVAKDRIKRDQVVTDLLSLEKWVELIGMDRDVQIVVGTDNVVVKVDLEEPHSVDSCRLPLLLSAQMLDLIEWSKSARSMNTVVKSLRSVLQGCCSDEYRRIFSRVDFQRMNNGGKKIRHDGESLGKSIEKSAQSSEGDIPEMLVFEVKVFKNVHMLQKQKLYFAVEVNPETEMCSIHAVADCVELAKEQSAREIADCMAETFEHAMVLCGR